MVKFGRKKYRNVKTTVGGITFDSKAEAARYGQLLLMARAGEIRLLVLQPKFPITITGKGKPYTFVYLADFQYERGGKIVVEDVKGFRTAVYRLKKGAVEAVYGVEIVEIGKKRGNSLGTRGVARSRLHANVRLCGPTISKGTTR